MSSAKELEKVIAFEPDRRNFRKLSEFAKTVEKPTISAHKLGAWSHSDSLLFDSSGNRNANLSSVGGAKLTEISVDSVDNVARDFSPDYIKYDVEGSEYEALIGSRGTIAAHSPTLLVSLYHRSEDLYKLPILVKELCPDYSLYLRKLPYIPAWDLNLYAVNKSK
jgi:FkbM family methyltransferase